jgi:hypothetical protein
MYYLYFPSYLATGGGRGGLFARPTQKAAVLSSDSAAVQKAFYLVAAVIVLPHPRIDGGGSGRSHAPGCSGEGRSH